MKKIITLLIAICLLSVLFLDIIPISALESNTISTNLLMLPEIIGIKEAEKYGYATRLKNKEENLNTLVFSTDKGD